MVENAGNFSRETTLYNQPSQVVIRKTADILDNLESDRAQWVIDHESARQYLGNNTVPFVRSARENFHLITPTVNADDFKDAVTLARRIPYRAVNPSSGEFYYKSSQIEPIGFTLVILAHMSQSRNNIPGFKPPSNPAELLAYLEDVEKNLLGIALDKIDPAKVVEDPTYLRTKRFFTQGKRIPIKLAEDEIEKKARMEYELHKLLGFTN